MATGLEYRTDAGTWVRDLSESLDILPVFSNLTLLTTAKDGSVGQTREFSELVEYAKGSRLVILDPLADLFDLDENGNREGRAIVQVLRQLSLLTGAGVLGVHTKIKRRCLQARASPIRTGIIQVWCRLPVGGRSVSNSKVRY